MKFFEISGDDWSSVFCFLFASSCPSSCARGQTWTHPKPLRCTSPVPACRRFCTNCTPKAKRHLSFPASFSLRKKDLSSHGKLGSMHATRVCVSAESCHSISLSNMAGGRTECCIFRLLPLDKMHHVRNMSGRWLICY